MEFKKKIKLFLNKTEELILNDKKRTNKNMKIRQI